MKILFFNASAAANVYEAPGKKEGQQKRPSAVSKSTFLLKRTIYINFIIINICDNNFYYYICLSDGPYFTQTPRRYK